MTFELTSKFWDVYNADDLDELLNETLSILITRREAGDTSAVNEALIDSVVRASGALQSAKFDAAETFDIVTLAMRERDDEEA
jgi:hypothetical protein